MPTKKTKRDWSPEIMQYCIRIMKRLDEIDKKVEDAIYAAERSGK